jgi:hypothetical protein
VNGDDPRSRLLAAISDGAERHPNARRVAVGWATVEMERGVLELAAALSIDPGQFRPAAESLLLGARTRLASSALADGVHVVLLEPSTEGRLAAALARHDEGPLAIWTTTGPGGGHGLVLSAEREGPLGPERVVVDGPAHGPYRLLIGPPGTIAP